MPYPKKLILNIGELDLPQFLPDATFGQVRHVSAQATSDCGIEAVVMNIFHLMQKPGASTIKSLGGLHRMTGWDKPIFTDSGGFQAYSLIRQNIRSGSLSDKGIIFHPQNKKRKLLLSPEKCIQLQVSFDADVLFCLDDCTHVDDPAVEQALSVDRTIQWAKKCRKEFDRLMEEKEIPRERRPKLFAVIQGGDSVHLRKRCANELLEIGFDGFGYGGWPLDRNKSLLEDMLTLVRELVPDTFAAHALGVGHPPYILRCARIGYGLFDSAMPTRDARHGRLYCFSHEPEPSSFVNGEEWFSYLYINDKRHIKSSSPIDEHCKCKACMHYSRGYLRHLFKINDGLYYQLATQHNLSFMVRLMKFMQNKI